MYSDNPMVVLKFGGTSVTGLERWRTIAAIARSRMDEGLRPVLVCSALSGITNDLETLLASAIHAGHEPTFQTIRQKHHAMAEELGIRVPSQAETWLSDLSRLATGISMIGEVSPRTRAQVMAMGELLSTSLGAAYLETRELSVSWLDAREMLTTTGHQTGPRAWLQAGCQSAPDPDLLKRLSNLPGQILLTQGFIARNRSGETVLLGRGGSDTSAACLAVMLDAVRCEIWTDVPGIYTADPREVPDARLLKKIGFDEAQEIATCGAKVLHPRCLPPLREASIPCRIHCTPRPELEGTIIAHTGDGDVPQVKALSSRSNVVLVSMETLGMWGQVGFLSDSFSCFKKHGISVDLVSTSETNVTASFDGSILNEEPDLGSALLKDLKKVCDARFIGPCAAVSLVGRGIRTILHRLGPALEVFEEHQVHLVSQAASDLNLTFVVDENQAPRLIQKLHALLFEGSAAGHLGPTWVETFASSEPAADEENETERWWRSRKDDLVKEASAGTPVFVYDTASLDQAAGRLTALQSISNVLFAIKANPNPAILRRLYATGLSFECVSPGELAQIFKSVPKLPPERVLFTPNFGPRHEYEEAFGRGVHVSVDSLYPLQHWPEVFRGRSFFLRIDPGQGLGHHPHVRTAGPQSKFGITPEEIDEVQKAVTNAGGKVTGLHVHAGSGILDPSSWVETAQFLGSIAQQFGDIEVLDLGGGLGVPEKAGQAPLDLHALDAGLTVLKKELPGVSLWLEPGRYLVAESGVLLARVTQTKTKGNVRYVGVDAGMHTLIRPALYGAYHRIANLSRLDEQVTDTVHVVGPICETGDTLGRERPLPASMEGDVLLIDTVGAYGRSMSSEYNLRGTAREVLLD